MSSVSYILLLAAALGFCCLAEAGGCAPDGCKTILCPYGSTCIADPDGNAICKPNDCPEACITLYDPVCGTDGRTYGNLCELESAACRLQRDLRLSHEGSCG